MLLFFSNLTCIVQSNKYQVTSREQYEKTYVALNYIRNGLFYYWCLIMRQVKQIATQIEHLRTQFLDEVQYVPIV